MYRTSYAEVLEDSAADARAREREALGRAVELLETAEKAGIRSRQTHEALVYVRGLWAIFLEDLGGPGNGLPDNLKASLISIGRWIMRQTDLMREGKSDNFRALIDINATLRDGLR